MAITISEIAKLANVSRTTVSYVLNNKGNIPDSTRERVLKVMRENEYQPNNNARNLAIGKNLRVGVFIPSTEYLKRSVFFSEISAAILSVINQHGIDLVIEIYDNVYERWLRNAAGLDGAILINPGSDENHLKWLRSAKIPVVVIGKPDESHKLKFVDGPNVEMASAMTQRVIELGHKNLLYILPSRRYTLTEDFLKGIQNTIDACPEQVKVHCCYTEYGGDMEESWLREILEEAGDATAVFVDSDYKAVQTLELLKKIGRRVPEDLSLVCLSGSYLTQIPTPKIFSSNPDNTSIGEMAAEELIGLIEQTPLDPARQRHAGYYIQEGESLCSATGGRK